MSDVITVRWTLSIGIVGCRKEGELEFDREDWDAMSEDERDEEMKEAVFQEIEWDYHEK